ncbi:DNA-directed RNA polymerase subunit B'' [Candidatus Woesearchaeota archaeon]|nr:DNA-directed RNA polymerase subunit B'' [Candidatus Woesearchaeota archaeon]
MINRRILIQKYFKEHSIIESNIASFNNFVDKEVHNIIEEIGEVTPTIIPPDIQDFKIKFDKISIDKPQITEADGSKRNVYPSEARLRSLTYAAPIHLNVSAHIDGVQRETFTTPICKLPIMLKSKYCHLSGLNRDDLIKHGEDPEDPGGYFILNGNERVLIMVEDLASNRVFINENKTGPSKYTAKMFSARGSYRIPHVLEQMKDGIIYLSFTRFKRIPVIAVIKALGLTKDQEIMKFISRNKHYDTVFINLYNSMEIKSEDDALDFISKKQKIAQPREVKIERTRENLDKYLLPHLGLTEKSRIHKAYNLCKLVRRLLLVTQEGMSPNDKDHYMNKQLQLSGDLLAELFRMNMRVLVNDILYNFQRLVKRGKFSSVKIIIRDKLLTSRVLSAMATGSWVGGRRGISQNIDRTDYLATLSHLQRVVSLLSVSQENFEARELHPTHWGRLCAVETPEGTSIGLRKNLALLCNISQEEVQEEKIRKVLENAGLTPIK